MNEAARRVLCFLSYALDPTNAQLRHGDAVIPLRPKTLAVLHCLAQRSGRLVTKAELLDAVWPDTAVTESTLTSSIKELRRVFHDDPRRPRIIETAHRHGYRFIAEVRVSSADDGRLDPAPDLALPPPDAQGPEPARSRQLFGRGAELAQLDAWLARALTRERQVGFVTGEAGIGKTALVGAFCARVRAGGVLLAHGQCLEHHGASEAYLPVLEALERLCATPEGAPLLTLMRRHAPTWLAQLGGLLSAEEVEALRRHLVGTTRERMLRELASLVVALPAPLVLVLEDLQWSDNATIDLVAVLAQRADPAPLLVVGTYRPVDVVISEHPLRTVHQQLRAHKRSRELWLQNLDAPAVADYVGARWPDLAAGDVLAAAICERTDGNPLFVLSVADDLAANGVVANTDGRWVLTSDVAAVRVGVPSGLRPMIATRIDRLADSERDVLEVGSVVGRKFSAAVVAAALEISVVDVEAQLARLARRGQLVTAAGETVWPDGSVAGQYELIHSLYQSALMDRVPPARRRQLHERIAARLEAGYGARSTEIATELAYHFEAGSHPERAVPHLEEAAARAVQRGAAREAGALLDRALAVLDSLLPMPERTLQTIRLCLSFGVAMGPLFDPGAAAIEAAWKRARALSEPTEDLPQLFQALAGMSGFYLALARFDEAKEAAARLAAIAPRLPSPAFTSASNMFNGMVQYHTGDLTAARSSLEQAHGLEAMTPPNTPALHLFVFNYHALTLLHLGHPDQARARTREAGAQAEAIGTPFDRAQAAMFACFVQTFVRDVDALTRAAAVAQALADDYGFPIVLAVAMVGRGRALVARGDHDGGLAAMRGGIDAYRSRRQALVLPALLTILADAEAETGNIEEGLVLVAEARALMEASGEVRLQAELQRIEGELRRQRSEHDAAARCFRRAIEIARRQSARWWELRASVYLARLWQQQGKRAAAHRALAPIARSFTEGHDTADVCGARELLAAVA